MAVVPQSPLQVVWADRELTTISAIIGYTLLTIGRQFTIYVQATGQESSVVTVQVNQLANARTVGRGALAPALDLISHAVGTIVPRTTG